MKTEKVLLNLIKNNIKLGRIVKKEFDEMPQVHSKSIEAGPSPVTPKGIEKLEPKIDPKLEPAPKGIEKLEPKLEPKFEPKLEPKAESKIEPSK